MSLEDFSEIINSYITPKQAFTEAITGNNASLTEDKKPEVTKAGLAERLELASSLQEQISHIIEGQFFSHIKKGMNTSGAEVYTDLLEWQHQLAELVCSEVAEIGHRSGDSLDDKCYQGKDSTLAWQLEQIFDNYIKYYSSERQKLRMIQQKNNELIYSQSTNYDFREKMIKVMKETRSQMDVMYKHQQEVNEIRAQLLGLVYSLCESLDICLTMQPNITQQQELANKQHYL